VAVDEGDWARGLTLAEDGFEACDFFLWDGEADDYFDFEEVGLATGTVSSGVD